MTIDYLAARNILVAVKGHAYAQAAFHAMLDAVPASRPEWHRSAGSPLFAWTRRDGASDIVYVQGGCGPSAYENVGYRTLLGNAAEWLTKADSPPAIS